MDILEFRVRVLVIQAARGPVLPVSSGDRAIRLSWAVLETHGPAGSGGRLSVIRQPRRRLGTSRKWPSGWPQRGPAGGGLTCRQVCWNRVPSAEVIQSGVCPRNAEGGKHPVVFPDVDSTNRRIVGRRSDDWEDCQISAGTGAGQHGRPAKNVGGLLDGSVGDGRGTVRSEPPSFIGVSCGAAVG